MAGPLGTCAALPGPVHTETACPRVICLQEGFLRAVPKQTGHGVSVRGRLWGAGAAQI